MVRLLILLFLFIVGCSGGTGNQLAQYNFKQGISELSFKFLQNAPPEKLYRNSDFRIVVDAHNEMAYDLTNAKMRVVGLDNTYFELEQTEKAFGPLVGKSLLSPEGDRTFVEFDGRTKGLLPGASEYRATYFLKTNFNSLMDFSDTICINPNLYAVYDSGCSVEAQKSYGGQGAPLAVQQLEEIFTPAGNGGGMELRFTLANRGRGKMTTVRLLKSQLGGEDLKCEFADAPLDQKTWLVLKEEEKEARLTCKTFLRDQRSYTTTLSLSFSYDYEVKDEHQLLLVK